MTELAKPAMSFLSRCDLDLILIYVVTQYCSSIILMGLYASFIGLDILKISSKSGIRLLRYCKFSSRLFFTPLVLYVWRKPYRYLWELVNISKMTDEKWKLPSIPLINLRRNKRHFQCLNECYKAHNDNRWWWWSWWRVDDDDEFLKCPTHHRLTRKLMFFLRSVACPLSLCFYL